MAERLIFGPWFPDEVKWHCGRQSLYFLPMPQKFRLGLCWYYFISEMSPNIISNPQTCHFSVHADSKTAGDTSVPVRTVCGRGFCLHQGVKIWLISEAPADRCGTKKYIFYNWLSMYFHEIYWNKHLIPYIIKYILFTRSKYDV